MAGIDLRLNETLAPGDEIRCSRCNAIVELDACTLANPRPISDVLDRLDGGHSPRCPRAGGDEDTAPLPRFVRSVADQLTPDQRRTAGIAIGGLPPPPVLRVKSFSERHPLLEEFDDVNARIDALERQARPGEEERVSRELAKLRARREVLEAAVDQLAADVQPSSAAELSTAGSGPAPRLVCTVCRKSIDTNREPYVADGSLQRYRHAACQAEPSVAAEPSVTTPAGRVRRYLVLRNEGRSPESAFSQVVAEERAAKEEFHG